MAWSAELHGHGSVMSHADRPTQRHAQGQVLALSVLGRDIHRDPADCLTLNGHYLTGGANSQALADATGIPKWIKNSSSHRGDE